ncbi:tetraacyldisaccharide 4'-kinase [Bordetella sp. 02P26C-1]|nr:tetraacyldisaccharide 4'-kinase [Bordetella sp. 02P26C-1]
MTRPDSQSRSRGAALTSWLQRQWQHDGWFATFMRPLAALTARHVARRRAQYAAGEKPVYRAPVPVIVIGNIFVGGTGKTPVVIATVQALRTRGWTPGVISRGYGVKVGAEPRVGVGELDPAAFGDEPALIAHTAQVPVAVHPRRALAVEALLKAYPHTNVIVSDDGLQHLALARDIEIVVQDGRGVGNGRLLPAGPLREPASRLDNVHYVITNRANDERPNTNPTSRGAHHVDMWLQPDMARHLATGVERPLTDFAGAQQTRRIAAAAGIGNPERFFSTLRAAGINPDPCLALPDHFDYRQSPFDTVPGEVIFITAKDGIKCRRAPDTRLWEVPVQARFSDPNLFDQIDVALRGRATTR